MKEKVAILGASHKKERYAYKAFRMLQDYGHTVFPVNPGLNEIEGIKVFSKLSDITEKIDTLTLYVNPEILEKSIDQVLALKPRRVIFNPGTEDAAAAEKFEAAGIKTEDACTLVLLRTNQYE